MTLKLDLSDSASRHQFTPGEKMTLDRQTPRGLFESEDGNRYIITEDAPIDKEMKIAIVLRHSSLVRFRFFRLPKRPTEFGTWFGPFKIRLNCEPCHRDKSEVGVISFIERWASIDCSPNDQDIVTVSLGNAGDLAKSICNLSEDNFPKFDSWIIEASSAPDHFSESLPARRSWVLEVDQS